MFVLGRDTGTVLVRIAQRLPSFAHQSVLAFLFVLSTATVGLQ
jgi:hypothetical protein